MLRKLLDKSRQVPERTERTDRERERERERERQTDRQTDREIFKLQVREVCRVTVKGDGKYHGWKTILRWQYTVLQP